jgi:hypothetical protein
MVAVTVTVISPFRLDVLVLSVADRYYTQRSGMWADAHAQRWPTTGNGGWPVHSRCSPSLEWSPRHWPSHRRSGHIGGSYSRGDVRRGRACRSVSRVRKPFTFHCSRSVTNGDRETARALTGDRFSHPLRWALGVSVRSVCSRRYRRGTGCGRVHCLCSTAFGLCLNETVNGNVLWLGI